MTAINTTKARLLSCSIRGLEIRLKTRKASIRESIQTPYLSGEITVYDDNNIINKLQLVGGEDVRIKFDAPVNSRIYDATLHVLSIKGETSPENLRTVIYNISLVGPEYFKDRANMVQKSARNTTGAALAQQVWGEIFGTGLRIPVVDSLVSKGTEPFTIPNLKPFTALAEIRKRMVFPAYKTGNTLLFRDRDVQNLVPLEHLFKTLSAQEWFVQKTTWGERWSDMFESEHAIIEAKTQSRGNMEGGRSAISGVAAATNQGKVVFDAFKGKIVDNNVLAKIAKMGSLGTNVQGISQLMSGAFGSLISGRLGGAPNMQVTNSERTDQSSDYTQKSEGERLYGASAMAGPQYIIKVPLQKGIDVTVGKGIEAKLIPPAGDQVNMERNPAGGLMLVTDLVHEVYNDNRLVQGTTTMHCIKGGFDF